ncbi:kinase-like protein [Xylariaceae sp. FL1019]|nr:kinase-like protein [Xylariaceae sp. FL1019]
MALDFSKPLELPYFAATTLTLPTHEAIISTTGDSLSQWKQYRVVCVNDQFIAKFGDLSPLEGENMLFVQQNTTIPVPKVYAIYSYDTNKTMIIMEKIVGRCLADVMDDCYDLSEPERTSVWTSITTSIGRQLREQVNQLRSIPSPGYYGSIGGRPALRRHQDEKGTGPYTDVVDFIKRVFDIDYPPALYDDHIDEVKDRYVKKLMEMPSAVERPVFTHGDIYDGNIMVKEDGTPVLIDYGFSAFLPPYWEYMIQEDLDEEIPFLEERYPQILELQDSTGLEIYKARKWSSSEIVKAESGDQHDGNMRKKVKSKLLEWLSKAKAKCLK